jgi:trk system potassium uptake protein TrkH
MRQSLLAILFRFAFLLGILAAAMLFCSLVALSFNERDQASIFLGLSACYSFLAGGLILSTQEGQNEMRQTTRLVLLVSGWFFLPLLASLPLLLASDMAPIHALFETYSAMTTTGATVITQLNAMPKSLLMWRSLLQWLGGLATLVSLVSILAPHGVGGLPVMRSGRRFGGPGLEKIRNVFLIYAGLSSLCCLGLLLFGVPFFYAVSLAFSTLSTGGMMPMDGTLADLNNRGIPWLLTIFMLLGSTSIVWQVMVVQRRNFLLHEHRESYAMLIATLLVGLGLTFILYQKAGIADNYFLGDALREGFFTAASLISTTGFKVEPTSFALLPLAFVCTLVFIGGATMSTAGGIKFYRVGIMALQAMRELNRTIYPHSIRASHMGSVTYTMQSMKSVWTLLACALLLVMLCTAVLSLDKMSALASMTASISAFANIGQVYSADWSITTLWPGYQQMSSLSLLALMITMVIGRLEVVAFFAVAGLMLIRR